MEKFLKNIINERLFEEKEPGESKTIDAGLLPKKRWIEKSSPIKKVD